MQKRIGALVFSFLFLFGFAILASAQTPPPLPPEGTVGTPVDTTKPIELKMDLPVPPEGQSAPQTNTTEQIVNTSLPDAPAFLKDVKTKEQYDALTDAQKKEAEEFFTKTFAGPGAPAGTEQGALSNTVNCFDYYHFGSVQVDLSNTTGSAVTGTQTTFSGTIKNNNTYPVVDGAVYAKVFRLPKTGGTPVQGYDVVDQFFVKEHIDLPANAEVPASFTWKVPTYLAGGTYQIAFFYTSAKKFNLLGLSFTDDVVGNTNTFTVGSEIQERVYFDKEQVTVDGQKYFFAAFTPKLNKDKPITAETTLVNETDQEQTISVVWKVYKWDAQTEDNKLEEKTETISIPAKGILNLSHTVSDTSSSVYLVIAEAKYQDTKSILNIRFTRDGVPTTRINFPALTSYPLVANQETTLFSCLHSAGTLDLVENGKLVLTLTDKQGNVIHTYTYEGGVTGNMMAIKSDFTPTKDYDTFTLKAELFSNSELVDQAEMHYDCKTLNNGTCTQEEIPLASFFGDGNAFQIMMSVAVLALLILLLTLLVGKRRQHTLHTLNIETRNTATPAPRNKTIVSVLVGLALLGGGLGMPSAKVEAASVTSQATYPGMMTYEATASAWVGQWYNALNWPTVTVGYNANIRDGAWNIVAPGASIPVGTQIYFEPLYGAVSYSGTGYTSDTPTGEWVGGATFPDGPTGLKTVGSFTVRTAQCGKGYIGNSTGSYGGFTYTLPVYIPLSVHTAGSTLNTSASTATLINVGGGWYRVDSVGIIKATFNFNATYAKFYYEYINTYNGDGCVTSYSMLPLSNTSINIPATSIQYDITAYSPNTAPNAPTISGNGGTTGQSLPFSISGTDPNGDQVKYGIDWCINASGANVCDGVVDNWVPSSGLVNSGTAQTAYRSWATAGSKTFKVLTQDSKSGQSGWTSHTIIITDRVWTTYCSGSGNTPSTNDWQWWQYSDDNAGRTYRFLRPGDGTCTPCTDPVPALSFAHSTLCAVGTGVATKTIVDSCTGAVCEYACDTTYKKSTNGVCVPVPVITTFTINGDGTSPVSATEGNNVDFAWTSTYATSCSIMGQGFDANNPEPSNGSVTGKTAGALSPKVKGPYKLTCKRNDLPSHPATRSIDLTVNCTVGPITGIDWSSCPVCDQEGDATQSRTVVTNALTCATGTESKPCSVPKCKPTGFQEVAP